MIATLLHGDQINCILLTCSNLGVCCCPAHDKLAKSPPAKEGAKPVALLHDALERRVSWLYDRLASQVVVRGREITLASLLDEANPVNAL